MTGRVHCGYCGRLWPTLDMAKSCERRHTVGPVPTREWSKPEPQREDGLMPYRPQVDKAVLEILQAAAPHGVGLTCRQIAGAILCREDWMMEDAIAPQGVLNSIASIRESGHVIQTILHPDGRATYLMVIAGLAPRQATVDLTETPDLAPDLQPAASKPARATTGGQP